MPGSAPDPSLITCQTLGNDLPGEVIEGSGLGPELTFNVG